jgi:hypothetical protein
MRGCSVPNTPALSEHADASYRRFADDDARAVALADTDAAGDTACIIAFASAAPVSSKRGFIASASCTIAKPPTASCAAMWIAPA